MRTIGLLVVVLLMGCGGVPEATPPENVPAYKPTDGGKTPPKDKKAKAV